MPAPLLCYDAHYADYFFGPQHPFRPARQQMLLDLLGALGRAPGLTEPPPATRADVLAVHEAPFVDAVEAASTAGRSGGGDPGGRFGLGRGGDTPAFEGMDAATRRLAGGTLAAARHLAAPAAEERAAEERAAEERAAEERAADDEAADDEAAVALQLGGGLHHAHAGHASGFCVYNDLAVAIHHLLEKGLRVAYLDIDVHHGDGVQAIFYRDPRVLTISLHESGRTLFPGTGFPSERGAGPGAGSALNVPLAPATTDDSYLDAFEAVVPGALARFAPDVLVAQCGADAHFKDPLAHLALTTRAYETLFRRIRALAEAHAGGRLLATHGGGYDLDAAARVWALAHFVFTGEALPEGPLPDAWRERWQSRTAPAAALHDAEPPDVPEGAANEAAEHNRRAVEAVLERVSG